MYADLRPILDACLAHDGGTYVCADHGQAVHWRQRAYQFRKLFAELQGSMSESPYDVIVMPRIPDDSSTVVINIRKQIGDFTPRNVDATSVEIPLDVELLEEAEALARQLGVENDLLP
jgi:hypothetical protein